MFGADGRLKLHNEAFEAFWGIAPAALQSAPDFDDIVELCIPRLHNRQFWRDLKGRITDPDPQARAPWEDEMATAERRVVAFQSRPLPDGATLIGFADITATRRLQEALRDREAALAEAERLKRAFVGSVSYELRTPLTTIIGYSELLERDQDGLAEKERGYIGAVRAAASHLARSINDVLATAEVDAGETVLDIGDVDIGALLSAAAARSTEESRVARVEVEISIDSDFGLMSGDAVRLGQVLDHLIENALRHTPAGGVISLSAVRGTGEVRLSVADNGRGFPFDVQAHIFDRFSSHNRGGPGLGLALVRALVELHGGWVALESEPGLRRHLHLPSAGGRPGPRGEAPAHLSPSGKALLVLAFRHSNDKSVEVVGDLDLAREPRVRLDVFSEVQHGFFHGRRFAGLLGPGRIDIDVAGRAGACAAAVRVDAGDVVLDRAFHDGEAAFHVDDVFRATKFDVGDLRHGLPVGRYF